MASCVPQVFATLWVFSAVLSPLQINESGVKKVGSTPASSAKHQFSNIQQSLKILENLYKKSIYRLSLFSTALCYPVTDVTCNGSQDKR